MKVPKSIKNGRFLEILLFGSRRFSNTSKYFLFMDFNIFPKVFLNDIFEQFLFLRFREPKYMFENLNSIIAEKRLKMAILEILLFGSRKVLKHS